MDRLGRGVTLLHGKGAYEGASTNVIYADVLNYRDKYSVALISDKLKSYNRIFIMMGADHIKNQETELRKIFDEMK